MLIFLEIFLFIVLSFFAYRGCVDVVSKEIVRSELGRTSPVISFLRRCVGFSAYGFLSVYLLAAVKGWFPIALISCFFIYAVYLWGAWLKVDPEGLEETLREHVANAITAKNNKKTLRFLRHVWLVSYSPFIAGIIGAIFFKEGNYKQASIWFKESVDSDESGDMESEEETMDFEAEENPERENGLYSNPIEHVVFSSMLGESLFRLGKFDDASQVWNINRDILRKGVVFLHADQNERGKILEGDDDTIEGLYLSLDLELPNSITPTTPPVEVADAPRAAFYVEALEGEGLAESVLWWEGVSVSPYPNPLLEDEEDEDTQSGFYDEEADEESVARLQEAHMILENYNNLTSELLRKFYANTLFGSGFIKYVRNAPEAAEHDWEEGVRRLNDFSCKKGLEVVKEYPTPKVAYEMLIRENSGTLKPSPLVTIGEAAGAWLKNFPHHTATLYAHMRTKKETL